MNLFVQSMLKSIGAIFAIVTLSCDGFRSRGIAPDNPGPRGNSAAIMPLTDSEQTDRKKAADSAQDVVLMAMWNGQQLPHEDIELTFMAESPSTPSEAALWVVLWGDLRKFQDDDPQCAKKFSVTHSADMVIICGGRMPPRDRIKKIVARDIRTGQLRTSYDVSGSLNPDGSLGMVLRFY